MKAAISVVLAALTAFPLRAVAEGDGHPRVIEREGKVCLQRLDADGTVLEECRDRVLAPAAEPAADAAEAPAAPPPGGEPAWIAGYRATLPNPERPRGNPVEVARAQAEEDAMGGAFLAGGVLGGCLLNVLGCGGVTLLGMASNPTPPDQGRWTDPAEETAYRLTYRDEVRSIRTRHALIGGTIGLALLAGTIFLITQQAVE